MSSRPGKRISKKHKRPSRVIPRTGGARLGAQMSSLKRAKVSAARVLANAATAGFLGIEKKFLDSALGASTIASAGALTGGMYDPNGTGCTGCLSIPAQNDTEQGRDGKRIVIDSLILKGYVALAPFTGSAPIVSLKIFVAVVLDTQTNGAQMTSELCFKNLLGSALGSVDPMKNLLSGKRFRILKSQVFDLTPSGISPTSATVAFNGVRRDFDWYIPFKGGLPVEMNSGVTADVANCVDNSIHVVAFSTLADSTIAYNARIRFQG